MRLKLAPPDSLFSQLYLLSCWIHTDTLYCTIFNTTKNIDTDKIVVAFVLTLAMCMFVWIHISVLSFCVIWISKYYRDESKLVVIIIIVLYVSTHVAYIPEYTKGCSWENSFGINVRLCHHIIRIRIRVCVCVSTKCLHVSWKSV